MAASTRESLSNRNDIVEVRRSTIDRGGKGLFAKPNILANEQIWTQRRPLIAALDYETLAKACSNCYGAVDDVTRSWLDETTPAFEVRACGQCKLLKFCSKTCQVAAWKRHHSVECKFFAQYSEHDLIRAICEKPLCRSLMQLMAMHKTKTIKDTQWKDILSLQAWERGEDDEYDEPNFDDKYVKVALMAVSNPAIDFPTAEKLLGILRRNMFTLISSTFDTMGEAFDPFISRANHDCQPNSCVVFDGAQISLRSIKPIAKDTEVTISYVDSTTSYFERINELQDGWDFRCCCATCALQIATWRDAMPLVAEVPAKVKREATQSAQSSASPAVSLMQLASMAGGSNTTTTAALLAHATSLREQCQQMYKLPLDQKLRHHETIEAFFKSTKVWPVYRQPRAANQHDLSLLYIEAGRYVEAAKLSASLYLLVDPIQLTEVHHPLRTVHGVRLLQLLNSFNNEEDRALPFDRSLVMFDVARKSIDGVKHSHGEHSRFFRAVWNRFSSGIMEMASSAQGLGRQELEDRVKAEVEQAKIWAIGADDFRVTQRSSSTLM